MSANYWIAQYIGDVFRNEPKNVGVFVEYKGVLDGRFFGEIDQQIDGRKLRAFPYPDVYRQWIEFWRKEVRSGASPTKLVNSSTSNFQVKQGGFVSDVEGSSIAELLDYLYALLVSEGGFREAISAGIHDAGEPAVSLINEVVDVLVEHRLLGLEDNLVVPHPIRRSVPVFGKTAIEHRPAFVQRNGHLYVMETVDFTIPQKKIARDHAGWSAYMFKDVHENNSTTEPIAIVRVTEEDKLNDDVQNGLALLKNEGNIVNWLAPDERNAFIAERQRLAQNP